MSWVHQPGPTVFWMVALVLAAAAIIDGLRLKVPNWLTFPFAAAGLGWSLWPGGLEPLESLAGLTIGLAMLLPLYAIGGMGAGDVKLMAAMGAWIGPLATLGAFVATALAGGAMALLMIAMSAEPLLHWVRMQEIGREILTVRDPVKLSEAAAARKPTMKLLPYGIPMAVGSIAYFTWAGMLFHA